MASGSQSMTTYYAKRIVGDASAAQANSALLQTGANVTADTWILNRTNRATTYGIKYVYDTTTTTVHDDENDVDVTTNNGHDTVEFYGGSATASAWVQLDTGDITAHKFIGALEGNADSATALTSNAGGTEQPIYFTSGKPAATSYALKATVNNGTAAYLAYYSEARAISSWSAAKFHDGCLSLFPTSSNYREGLRIHAVSNWSDITLCGADNTGDTGISANSWFIGNNNGNFYIARNGSPGSTAWLECVNNIWSTMNPIWIKGGSTEAGGNANRLTTSSGTPGNMQYNSNHRGVQIYSNGIAFADPYNGNSNNDAGWIRHIEETANTGTFEFAVGDDNSNEAIVFRRYTTSNTVGKEAYIFDASGDSSFPGTVTATKFSGPLTGNVTGNCSGSSGSCTGNAATATKATQDGSGNVITSKYVTVDTAQTITGTKSWGTSGAGGQLNGAATNGGINSIRVGDDVWLGDCNAGGIMGMKSTGNNCGFYFYKSDGTAIGQLYSSNGSYFYTNKCFYTPNTGSSWIDGQRYQRAALNVHTINNTGSYFPWVNQINDGSKKWFSFGILNNSFYWIGSANTRTANGYDYGLCFDISTGYLSGATRVYSAIWNDYAEFRIAESEEPGRVVIPSNDGVAYLTTARLQPGGRIISDTYGHAVGQSDQAKTPIGLAGRVLAYPYRDKSEYKIGDAVCSAPGGTVDIMTREEIMTYPDRIIGIVNEIPDYEVWEQTLTNQNGGGKTIQKIEVKGRIWIDIK